MNRLIACMLLASLTGCSFVYTEKEIAGAKDEFATFEPRLIGDWDLKDDGSPIDYGDPKIVGAFMRIERKSLDSNTLLLKGLKLIKAADGGVPAEVEGAEQPPSEIRVVKLDDLELISAGEKSLGFKTESELFHIGKMVWAKERFSISLMDSNFFAKNPELIAHRKQKGNIIITASIEELHAFLKANGNREDLWEASQHRLVFERRKRSAAK